MRYLHGKVFAVVADKRRVFPFKVSLINGSGGGCGCGCSYWCSWRGSATAPAVAFIISIAERCPGLKNMRHHLSGRHSTTPYTTLRHTIPFWCGLAVWAVDFKLAATMPWLMAVKAKESTNVKRQTAIGKTRGCGGGGKEDQIPKNPIPHIPYYTMVGIPWPAMKWMPTQVRVNFFKCLLITFIVSFCFCICICFYVFFSLVSL